ncbi:uncharacterized protein CLUP02_14626 [Colletotrichum lupini]|uniref:Uncharacterized protein n=1 Tax=Colletotrichum lupini TaxID=145971 RepID=A0A9Q8T4L5_9PEZI|nr:uncharacterized protein CLUP02_14626 [Colletotrichum lupini]UQC89098.1 hypothetical protein CLUP02_14626 [Colletotrichum lupini]
MVHRDPRLSKIHPIPATLARRVWQGRRVWVAGSTGFGGTRTKSHSSLVSWYPTIDLSRGPGPGPRGSQRKPERGKLNFHVPPSQLSPLFSTSDASGRTGDSRRKAHERSSNNSRSSRKRQSRLRPLSLNLHSRVEYDNPGNEGDELPVFPYGPHIVLKAAESRGRFARLLHRSRGTSERHPRNQAQQLRSKRAVSRTGPANTVTKTRTQTKNLSIKSGLPMTSQATTHQEVNCKKGCVRLQQSLAFSGCQKRPDSSRPSGPERNLTQISKVKTAAGGRLGEVMIEKLQSSSTASRRVQSACMSYPYLVPHIPIRPAKSSMSPCGYRSSAQIPNPHCVKASHLANPPSVYPVFSDTQGIPLDTLRPGLSPRPNPTKQNKTNHAPNVVSSNPFTRLRNALQIQAPMHLIPLHRSTSSMTSDTSPTVRLPPPRNMPPGLHSRRPQCQPSPGDEHPVAVPSRLWRRTFIQLFPIPHSIPPSTPLSSTQEIRHPFIPLVSAFLSLSLVPESSRERKRHRRHLFLSPSQSLLSFPYDKEDPGIRIPDMMHPTFLTPSPLFAESTFLGQRRNQERSYPASLVKGRVKRRLRTSHPPRRYNLMHRVDEQERYACEVFTSSVEANVIPKSQCRGFYGLLPLQMVQMRASILASAHLVMYVSQCAFFSIECWDIQNDADYFYIFLSKNELVHGILNSLRRPLACNYSSSHTALLKRDIHLKFIIDHQRTKTPSN